jgi:hypothetical protein
MNGNWVRNLIRRKPVIRSPNLRRSIQPRLEVLEDHPTPAANTLHWNGPSMKMGNVAANWKEYNAPVASNHDSLIFDNTQMSPSMDDIRQPHSKRRGQDRRPSPPGGLLT